MGTYADSNYQFLRQLVPCNTITAGDMTQTAGTSLAKFIIPYSWSKILIVKFGMAATTVGTSVTVPAQVKLQAGGVDVAGAVLTHPGATAVAWQTTEVDLNSVSGGTPTPSTGGVSPTNNLNAAPVYPSVAQGNLLEILIKTQGTGGTQSAFFYLLVQRDPTST